MGIQIIFRKSPTSYLTTTLDKLRAGFELIKFFHKGIFFSQDAEVWFTATSEALGGEFGTRISAENPYEATNRIFDYLKQLPYEKITKSIVLFKGIWDFGETKLAGYFSIQNDVNWREVYGDIEISAYAKGEFEDLVDALWLTQPIHELIDRLINRLKTVIRRSSLSLSQVTFSRGIPTKEDPSNLMALYAVGERRGLLSVFYTALKQSKDRNVIFKSRPLDTNFFLNTLAKNELANKRINKRLEKALILEKVGRSALYIAKHKNSFATCFKDISESIIKPALGKLPEEESVKEKINEGLSEYRDY